MLGFYVEVESEAFLSIAEIWPDGNAPEDPTADDVLAQMKKDGDKFRVINDWGLNEDTEIHIHGGGMSARWS